jgi:8-oxo-dGTP pyrophosphatase MutT (NUDIX family)
VISKAWTLLESRAVSDHRIFRIRNDIYRFEPTGLTRDFVVMESPDWVNVVPITDDGHVVLIRQYRHGIRAASLEIPGGIIDPHEPPEEAALRELREETGYAADRVRQLCRVRPNPAIQDNYQYCYVAEGCRRDFTPKLDPFEHIEVALFQLEEVPGLIQREEICNALVINAFYFLWGLRASL